MTQTASTHRYGKASVLGFDTEGGEWVAICDLHNTSINVASRNAARLLDKNTAEFCEECRDMSVQPQEDDSSGGWNLSTEIEQDEPDGGFENLNGLHEMASGTEPSESPLVLSDELEDSMRQATENWWVEEEARRAEAAQSTAQPILGTFHVGTTDAVHDAMALVPPLYFTSVCGHTLLQGEPAERTDPNMCPNCLAGVEAPQAQPAAVRRGRGRPRKERVEASENDADGEAPVKRGRGRPRKEKVAVEPVQPVASKFSHEIADVYNSLTTLRSALNTEPNVTDAAEAVRILNDFLRTFSGMLPRRRVGTQTGARSGLVRQSASVNPSEQLERAKAYADAGDKRAQEILEHVAVYVPGENCTYCLHKRGVETRHPYATGFCSIGRELRAMANRAA